MGFRSKLKAAVVKRLGGDDHTPKDVPARAPSSRHEPAAPTARPAAAAPAAPAPQPTPAPAAAPAGAQPIDPEMAAKASKHFEKTRRAVLSFVHDQGGVASMADMHDHSERRYFIAHKKFSDLMEGIVGEGLVDFDDASGEASITPAGKAYIGE